MGYAGFGGSRIVVVIIVVVLLLGQSSAEFQVSAFQVTPNEVAAGQTVNVQANVKNTGEVGGSYLAELKVDGDIVETREVNVDAGATETVSFTYSQDTDGTYILGVDGQTATLKVITLYGKLTLDDAPALLDLSTLLPSNFYEENAAFLGMSNADLGLGSDVSEVELYVSDEPMQIIYSYMMVDDDPLMLSSFDGLIQDDAWVKDIIESSIIMGMVAEGISEEDFDLQTQITHPDIGDSAVLGEGYISSMGITMGFDLCIFIENSAYVSLMSMTFSTEKQSLEPLAREIVNRVKTYQD